MSINGIGVGYPTWREAGKTQKNQTGTGFAAILHGVEEGSGDITIFSGAELASGSSYSVYKVKIWDKSGNVTERMVDVSKVDPKNCNMAEMYAYTADLKESGKGSFEDTVLKAAVAKAVKNAEQKSSQEIL